MQTNGLIDLSGQLSVLWEARQLLGPGGELRVEWHDGAIRLVGDGGRFIDCGSRTLGGTWTVEPASDIGMGPFTVGTP